MKKAIILLGVLLGLGLFSTPLQAQLLSDEQIANIIREIISEKLNLTPEEEDRFIPVFEKYQRNRRALKEEYDMPSLDLLSDDQVQGYIRKFMERQQKELELKQAFIQELGTVLPPRKVAKYLVTENNIRQAIIDIIKKRREERRGRRR